MPQKRGPKYKTRRPITLNYYLESVRSQILQHYQELQIQKKLITAEVLKNIFLGTSGTHTKKWLKSFEVRKLLNISPNTLTNLRINGTLPYTKIGGVIYYNYDDIQSMLEANN